jgi:hypothetical protein
MEVEILHRGEVRFEAVARITMSFLTSRQPWCSDSGMTPPEFNRLFKHADLETLPATV